MMACIRPTWVEINLDHLAHNLNEVKRLVHQQTQIMAVIKADGYGHGAVKIAKTLLDNGASHLAVATLSEGILLRKHYPQTPILILGYTPNAFGGLVLEYGLSQTVFSYDQAAFFSNLSIMEGKKMTVHVKIDTGMKRLGIIADEKAHDIIGQIISLEGLVIEGVFTHFAKADEADLSFTHEQVKRFKAAIDPFEGKLGLVHACNSAGLINCPEYHFDMVRAGIMLYGLYPSSEIPKSKVHLKEVMSWHTKLALVKELKEGEGVSYGHKFIAPKDMCVATLPLGYADGLSRALSFKLNVVIEGELRPVIGRICMDQCMVDVTGLALAPETQATIFGCNQNTFQSIDDIAKHLDTINYEIVCMVGKRVPRVYIQNNEEIDVEDFNLTYAM